MEARALDEAKNFLREQLAEGSKPATEIFDAAKVEGISVRTLRRAGKEMGIQIWKSGKAGKSQWSLKAEMLPST